MFDGEEGVETEVVISGGAAGFAIAWDDYSCCGFYE